MLAKEDFMVIQALTKRGVYQRDIAETLGVHPKTVQRALRRDGAPPTRPKRRPSLLDSYRAEVDRLLAEGVWNAVVIFRELQAQGYRGGLSILRDYIRPKRALRPGRATVRFETAPGQQLQSDWGELETVIAGEATVVHFLVNTLGYSRRFHFWCTTCEDAEHTYEGLIRSFEWFDGVAAEVLVDNQKCAVLAHPRTGATFNPRFVDLAERYGFVPRACSFAATSARVSSSPARRASAIGATSSTTRCWRRRFSTACSIMRRRSTSKGKATGSGKRRKRACWADPRRPRVAGVVRDRRPRQQRLAVAREALPDRLRVPSQPAPATLVALALEVGVQRVPTAKPGDRHEEVATGVADQPFHLPFVVALARAPETIVE